MKVPILQQVLGNEINIVLRCPGCNDRVVTDFVLKYVIPFSLPPNMNPCTLQDICYNNFELWPEVNDPCSSCDCRRLRNYEIKLISSCLIVKLEIFSLNKTGSCRIKNLKVNDVPETVVTIRIKKFKVISGIFHHGTTVNSGLDWTLNTKLIETLLQTPGIYLFVPKK